MGMTTCTGLPTQVESQRETILVPGVFAKPIDDEGAVLSLIRSIFADLSSETSLFACLGFDPVTLSSCLAQHRSIHQRKVGPGMDRASRCFRKLTYPDEVDEFAKQEFEAAELVDLTLVIARLNCWHRFNFASGKYWAIVRPACKQAA